MATVILDAEEERQLINTIKRGEEKGTASPERIKARKAKELLVRLNQFLVAAVASRYPNPKKSFSELMGAGNRGLLEALEHYDPGKKYKFSTYATWWIRAEIHKELGLPPE